MSQDICPITQQPIIDRVFCRTDGFFYERSAILEWLAGNSSSPTNRVPTTPADLQDVRNASEAMVAPVLTSKRSEIEAVYDGQNDIVRISSVSPPSAKNIIFVLDVSGSMGTKYTGQGPEDAGVSRLDLVVHSVKMALATIPASYRVGIVSFSTGARTVAELQHLTQSAKDHMIAKLHELRPEFDTNAWAGLRRALDITRSDASVTEEDTHILLLTDGECSTNPPRGLAETLNDQKFRGVVHTVGYGIDLDVKMLQSIAANHGGYFMFSPSIDMVGTIFVNFIATLLATSASRVAIGGVEIGGIVSGQSKYIKPGTPRVDDGTVHMRMELLDSEEITRAKANMRVLDILSNVTCVANAKECVNTLITLLHTFPEDAHIQEYKYAVFEKPGEELHTGQLSKAVDFWSRWGRIYFATTVHALKMQYCANFKDNFLQQFGSSPEFKKWQTLAEKAFLDTEIQLRSADSHGVHSIGSVAYYQPSGGCMAAETLVPIIRDGVSMCVSIAHVRRGDVVQTTPDKFATVDALVEMRAHARVLSVVNGVFITPYHPVCLSSGLAWQFPCNIVRAVVDYDGPVYSILLKERYAGGFVVHAEDMAPFYVASLAHGDVTSEVLGHEFFGSQALRKSIMSSNDYRKNKTVRVAGELRDPHTRVCGWIFQNGVDM